VHDARARLRTGEFAIAVHEMESVANGIEAEIRRAYASIARPSGRGGSTALTAGGEDAPTWY
jgi:hypothetical protein